jgi:Zn-dependent protease
MLGSAESRLVLVRHPVPVLIGRGGLAPILMLAGLFALVGAQAGLPVATATLMGGIGGTISLLVHEFGHVHAARRLVNIKASAVSLIWLGAGTRFEGSYASGRDQARVAMGGPGASIMFALSLFAAVFFPTPLSFRELLVALALFNLALAAVNLIPAPPLDGHKLIVGLMWSITGSEQKARRIIRRVGLGMCVLEIPAAVLLLVEKPAFGVIVCALAAGLYAQKYLVRKPRS